MIPIKKAVLRAYTPPVFEDDPVKSHAAHTLNLLIFGTGFCLTLYLVVTAIINPTVLANVRILLLLFPLLVVMRWLMHRGHVKIASAIFSTHLFAGFCVIAYYEGGVGTVSFNGLLLAALVAFLLLGLRGGIVFSLLALGVGLLFTSAESLALIPSPAFDHTPMSFLFTNFIYMLGAVGVLYIAIATVQKSISSSRRSHQIKDEALGALERSEARYHAIVEDQTTYFHRYSLDDRVLKVNDAYAALFSKTPLELEGMPHKDFMPTYLLNRLAGVRGQLSPANPVVFNDHRYITPDGEERWFQWHNRLICTPGGEPVEYLGVARDITEQRLAQEAIRRSETLYRTTIDAIDDMLHVVDVDLNLVLVNSHLLNTNQSLDLSMEVLGKNLFDVYPFLDEKVKEEYNQVFTTREEVVTEEKTEFNDQVVFTETHKIPIFDGEVVTKILTIIRVVTESKLAQQGLVESETRFRAVFENNPSPILVVELQQLVLTTVNPAFCKLLGYSREELIGRTIKDLTHPDDIEKYGQELQRLLSGEISVYSDEKRYFTKHDEVVWVEFSMTIIKNGDGEALYGLVVEQDITSRKEAEQTIQRKITELTTLHDVSTVVLRTTDEDELIEKVTSIIGEILYPDHFGILLVDADHDQLSIHGSYRHLPKKFYDLIILRGEGITGQVLQQGIALRYDNVEEAEFFIHTTPGIRSALAVPLKIDDRIYGVLNAESQELAFFSENDERLLVTVAGLLATAIEKSRHFTASQMLAQELEGLYLTALATTQLAEPKEYLAKVRDEVMRAIPHDAFAVMLVDIDDDEMEIAFAADRTEVFEKVVGTRFPIETAPLVGEVVDTKLPTNIGDLSMKEANYHLNHPIGIVAQSLLSVPLIHGKRIVGVMTTLSEEKDHFTKEHQRFLEALAPQVAIAFENTKLYQLEHQQRELAEALRDTANVISGTLDFDEVLERILSNLGRVVPHDSASIMTLDDGKLSAHIIATRGYESFGVDPEDLKKIVFPIDESSHLHEMLISRCSSILPDVVDHPGWLSVPQTTWIRSYLSAPIIVEDTVIGFMNLDSTHVDFFTPQHAERLVDFAQQAAIAIENAMLYQELEKHSIFLESAVQDATAELRASKERVETILNNSPDAILLLSPKGTIELCNDAFTQMFGYTAHDSLGGTFCMLAEEGQATYCRTFLQEVVAARSTKRTEISACHRDGRVFEVEMALAPIYVEDEILGIVSSLRDISSMKRVERMKDAFVSNVSHELRTPITSLKLNHSLIKMNPEEQDKYLERQDREIRRLADLIEDLLRLSRLDQKKIELDYTILDINQIADHLVEDRQSIAEDRDISLLFIEGASLPNIWADSGLIVQALSVLLTNALSYTPSGGEIVVRSELVKKADQSWCVLSVGDSGPGISPNEEPYLFDRFFRGETGLNSGNPGTGLGLAIAKEIVERHHGKIEVTRQGLNGTGATFSLWLRTEGVAVTEIR